MARSRLFLLIFALVALLIGSGSGHTAQAGGGAPYTQIPVPSFQATQEIEVTLPSEQDWIVGYGQTVTEYFQNGGQGATNSNYLWAFHGGSQPYRRFVVTNGTIMGPYRGNPEDAFCSLLEQVKKTNGGKVPGVTSGIFPSVCEAATPTPTPTASPIPAAAVENVHVSPLPGGVLDQDWWVTVDGQNLAGATTAQFRKDTQTRSVTAAYAWPLNNGGTRMAFQLKGFTPGVWMLSVKGSAEVSVELTSSASTPTPTPTPSRSPSLERVTLAGPYGPVYQLRIDGRNLYRDVWINLRSQYGEYFTLVPGYVWPAGSATDTDLATVEIPKRLTGNWEVSVVTFYGESNKMPVIVTGLQLLFPLAGRR